jgi:hypothetical protein
MKGYRLISTVDVFRWGEGGYTEAKVQEGEESGCGEACALGWHGEKGRNGGRGYIYLGYGRPGRGGGGTGQFRQK